MRAVAGSGAAPATGRKVASAERTYAASAIGAWLIRREPAPGAAPGILEQIGVQRRGLI
jgi:hypothetical protein